MNNEFQQEYIEESRQILKSLENSLLELEKRSAPDELNNVYRYLHTLKGSAGMFGFKNIETLAHELEYLFSDIRDGIRQLDEFVLDLTLHATDVFADLIEGFTVDDKIDVSALGYTGFGEGTGTTLEMVYNNELDRTYLRDVEADAQGHRFQVGLAGDWRESLDEDDMIFAPDAEIGLIGVAPEADPGHLLT